MTAGTIIKLLLVAGGVLLAGFFAGTETGIYRLSRFYLRLGIERRKPFFKSLGKLLADTHGMILSMLIGTNLAHYIVTSLVTIMLVNSLPNEHAAEFYSTLIMTPILFVFSELIPKNVFIYHADMLMPPLTPLIWFFHRFFTFIGIVPLLKIITDFISRITKTPYAVQPAIVAVQRHHISQIAADTIEEGILTDVQTKIIHRLVNIPDVRITEIITPLRKAQTISIHANRSDFIKKADSTEYSRLLVYENSPVNIVGYIEVYDVLTHAEHFTDLRDFIKPIIKLSARDSVSSALNRLKTDSQRIALVVSEKPTRILGLVTIKDLIEEFLGELTNI